jgi:hypothetical protein
MFRRVLANSTYQVLAETTSFVDDVQVGPQCRVVAGWIGMKDLFC